jgi:hypothetical protein
VLKRSSHSQIQQRSPGSTLITRRFLQCGPRVFRSAEPSTPPQSASEIWPDASASGISGRLDNVRPIAAVPMPLTGLSLEGRIQVALRSNPFGQRCALASWPIALVRHRRASIGGCRCHNERHQERKSEKATVHVRSGEMGGSEFEEPVATLRCRPEIFGNLPRLNANFILGPFWTVPEITDI